MLEVKSRVHCSGDDCLAELEYWADLTIEMRDTSDTFQSSSTPEIVISAPDTSTTGWTKEGRWTNRYYCPSCSAKNAEIDARKSRRKKA